MCSVYRSVEGLYAWLLATPLLLMWHVYSGEGLVCLIYLLGTDSVTHVEQP